MKKISVVISIYNEENHIEECIRHLRAIEASLEIIVVDGGSNDQSLAILDSLEVVVVHASKGRGMQFNAGARQATGDYFLFLHADTRLSVNSLKQIDTYFKNPSNQIGTFRMRFDEPHWILNFYSYFTRFDSIFTSFGDQCIFVKRDFFESRGGFPDWPFFEDVHFLHCARKHTKVKSLKGPAITSARRFKEKGLIRQQLFNAYLIIQYLLGVKPKELYEQYYR